MKPEFAISTAACTRWQWAGSLTSTSRPRVRRVSDASQHPRAQRGHGDLRGPPSMTLDDEAFVAALCEARPCRFADEKMMSAAGTLAGYRSPFRHVHRGLRRGAAIKHGVPRAAAYSLASQMLAHAEAQLEDGAATPSRPAAQRSSALRRSKERASARP